MTADRTIGQVGATNPVMRFTMFLALALAIATSALGAAPGSAQNFLDRAERLKAKGPLAFFDSDYGRLKAEAGMPPADPEREAYQIDRLRSLADEAGLDPAFAEKVLALIISEVIRHHEAHRESGEEATR